jgi:aspartyl-tRNA(Asn)/glutamyl-tRNA(Gln) amidotransferase subunit C
MSLDSSTVKDIAFLARIEVSEAEVERLVGELNNIIGWVEQLAEVDTTDVAPMTSVAEMTLPLRPDQVTDGDRQAQVLANAPAAEGGFYAVPKVIE